MNREQKRSFKAKARRHGFTDTEAEYILNHKPNQARLWEGAKVKLDYTWIRFSLDWEKNVYRKDYKEWITANKDKIFTVIFDKKRKENKKENAVNSKVDLNYDIMVCLEEDETNPKWLFYAGDLILLPGGTKKPPTKEEIEQEHFKTLDSKTQEIIQLALQREKT